MTTETHGKSRRGSWSPEYYSWASMHQRCTNPARNVFANYGGRGIKVCERWNSFENFFADMGERPHGHSIGRLDPNGDYCPENCVWHSDAEQARTRRNNKLTPFTAQAIAMAKGSQREIGRRFGVSHAMVGRIKRGEAWA
jgi:hypothetical protein